MNRSVLESARHESDAPACVALNHAAVVAAPVECRRGTASVSAISCTSKGIAPDGNTRNEPKNKRCGFSDSEFIACPPVPGRSRSAVVVLSRARRRRARKNWLARFQNGATNIDRAGQHPARAFSTSVDCVNSPVASVILKIEKLSPGNPTARLREARSQGYGVAVYKKDTLRPIIGTLKSWVAGLCGVGFFKPASHKCLSRRRLAGGQLECGFDRAKSSQNHFRPIAIANYYFETLNGFYPTTQLNRTGSSRKCLGHCALRACGLLPRHPNYFAPVAGRPKNGILARPLHIF